MVVKIEVSAQPLKIIDWVRKKFLGEDRVAEPRKKLRKPLILKAARHMIKWGFLYLLCLSQNGYENQKVTNLETGSCFKNNIDPIPAAQADKGAIPKTDEVIKRVKLEILTKWIDREVLHG